MLAAFGVGEVLLSMIWFFLFLMWIMLLFHIFGDIFRSKDLSGVKKVLWLAFVIITPYLGAFVYLIARGPQMTQNNIAALEAQEEAARAYIRSAAGTGPSPADELERIAALREKGVLDDAEFAAMKAKVLG